MSHRVAKKKFLSRHMFAGHTRTSATVGWDGENWATTRLVRDLDVTAPPYGVVLEDDPTSTHATENTEGINQALTDARVMEADVYLPGKCAINGPIVLQPGVRLYGVPPGYATDTADESGSWLVWLGGSSGVMVHAGQETQQETFQRAMMDGIGLDGKSQSGLTLLSIRSNSPTSSLFNTKNLTFRQCVFAKAGLGLQWGNNQTEQADFIHFEQCSWRNSGPIIVNGANCGDGSVFDTCTFSNMANGIVGDPYVDLVVSGFISFRSCSAGGDGLHRYDFIRVQGAGRFVLHQCQSEKLRYFLRHLGANDSKQVLLTSCVIDDDISLEGICRVMGVGNNIRSKIRIAHAGAKYFGSGDTLERNLGARVIDDSGGIYYNEKLKASASEQLYDRGDVIISAVPEDGSGLYKEVIARQGWSVPAWAPSTAYSPGTTLGWVASEFYNLDEEVVPTYQNGFKFICTVSGTSGATEPEFLKTAGISYTDGTVTWEHNGNYVDPVLRSPTVDNDHVYRLITAGTSGAVEPTWPTAAGATVTDGTCVWQEAGSSALIVAQNLP